MILLFLASASVALAQSIPQRPPVGIPEDAIQFKGRWYRLYLERVSWKHSKNRCKSLGGQLVVVPDAETQAFIHQISKGLAVWLGATDEAVEGLWRWVDGTEMTFKAWAGSDPSGGRAENFLLMRNGGWEDFPTEAGVIAGFICEWRRK
jgi:Lectin C-type domain